MAVALVFDLVAHEYDGDLLRAEALGKSDRECVGVDAAFGFGDAGAAGSGGRELVEIASAECTAVSHVLVSKVQAHCRIGPVASE